MRIRTSELLLAGALVELAAFALHIAVLLLGVAVWVAVTFSRYVLWPLIRLLGREVANAARRMWGEPLPVPRPRLLLRGQVFSLPCHPEHSPKLASRGPV